MKSKLLFAALLVASFSTTAFSQFQIGAHASYLKGQGDNDASQWGGGLHGKFFLGNNIALGGGFRTFPKSEKTEGSGTTYVTTNSINQFYGSLDLLLGKKKNTVQPYIGIDAGVSSSKRTILNSSGNQTNVNIENKQAFFYLGPKAGLNIAFGPAIGLFGQAQYGLTFGNGDPSTISPPSNINSVPVDKFFIFDAGLYFRIAAAKK